MNAAVNARQLRRDGQSYGNAPVATLARDGCVKIVNATSRRINAKRRDAASWGLDICR